MYFSEVVNDELFKSSILHHRGLSILLQKLHKYIIFAKDLYTEKLRERDIETIR